MEGTPYFLQARYEGSAIWEVVCVPLQASMSEGRYHFQRCVRAHHQKQLSPREERVFQELGLLRRIFFHVLDLNRMRALN